MLLAKQGTTEERRRRVYSLLARIGWGCTVQVMPRIRSPTGSRCSLMTAELQCRLRWPEILSKQCKSQAGGGCGQVLISTPCASGRALLQERRTFLARRTIPSNPCLP